MKPEWRTGDPAEAGYYLVVCRSVHPDNHGKYTYLMHESSYWDGGWKRRWRGLFRVVLWTRWPDPPAIAEIEKVAHGR